MTTKGGRTSLYFFLDLLYNNLKLENILTNQTKPPKTGIKIMTPNQLYTVLFDKYMEKHEAHTDERICISQASDVSKSVKSIALDIAVKKADVSYEESCEIDLSTEEILLAIESAKKNICRNINSMMNCLLINKDDIINGLWKQVNFLKNVKL